MKIVLLNDDFPPTARGGAGMVAFNLAVGLKQAGHDVSVITTTREAEPAAPEILEGVSVHRIHSAYRERWRSWLSLYNPRTVPKIRALLERLKPDVVHAHNVHYHLSYHSLAVAKRLGAKVFLTAHDVMLVHYGKLSEFIDPKSPECRPHPDYRLSPWTQLLVYRFWYNPFRNLAIRRYLTHVDRIFAVSQAVKEALEQNGVGGAVVMRNGLDSGRWQADPAAAEVFIASLGLTGKKIVLCSGRMGGLKGLGKAVEAMRVVRRAVPDAVLVVGGGKGFGQAAPEDAVTTGWMTPETMRAAIQASQAVIVPSIYLDPFPTATLEAMACAKPVVATCFGGTKEAVLDGETGFIVNPYDVETMAARIIELLRDAAKASRMGEAGRQRLLAAFTLERQVAETLRQYQA